MIIIFKSQNYSGYRNIAAFVISEKNKSEVTCIKYSKKKELVKNTTFNKKFNLRLSKFSENHQIKRKGIY